MQVSGQVNACAFLPVLIIWLHFFYHYDVKKQRIQCGQDAYGPVRPRPDHTCSWQHYEVCFIPSLKKMCIWKCTLRC